jgi:alkylation response protein AidB-like acyl-CoA dehydrogenase
LYGQKRRGFLHFERGQEFLFERRIGGNLFHFRHHGPKRGARGISCFVVEKGTKGFTFGKKETKMGIRASTTYELVFDNCRVPAGNMLGKEGFGLFVAQATFDISRPGVAAQALGIGTGAMNEALGLRQGSSPVRPIGALVPLLPAHGRRHGHQPGSRPARSSIQVTRAMDVDLKAAVDASEASGKTVYEEMKKVSTGRWTKYSGMVKLFCSDTSFWVSDSAIQLCGGIGYMRDFPVEKFLRDAKITQIYEGTNQIQRNEIGMMITKELAAKPARKALTPTGHTGAPRGADAGAGPAWVTDLALD